MADDFIEEARRRFDEADDGDRTNRLAGLADLKFITGDQWPEDVKREREADGRPALTINLLSKFVRSVVGDQKLNRSDVQVRPSGNSGSVETADLFEGLIRSITGTFEAVNAQDNAFKYAISSHVGYWRLRTVFNNDESFDQDIILARVPNPAAVYFQPNLKTVTYEDADYAFVIDDVPRKEYERLYKGAAPIDFDRGSSSEAKSWVSEDFITVAEYWFKKHTTRKLLLVENRSTKVLFAEFSDKFVPADNLEVIRTRDVDTVEVRSVLMNGVEKIEKEKVWAGKYIPIIPVIGEEFYVDGQRILKSLVRDGRDPQALYNHGKSCLVELMNQIPKTSMMGVDRLFEGYEELWAGRNRTSSAFLPYKQIGSERPQQVPGPQIPNGLFNEIVMEKSDVEEAIGVFGSSFGKNTNERSGRAIVARQSASDTSVFPFVDSLQTAQMYTGKVLVDLIPQIYDSERWVRIVGKDGDEQQIQVNTQVADNIKNDLTVGKYDVSMDVGPSFRTQRLEGVNAMLDLANSVPGVGVVIADLIIEGLDFPGSRKVLERLQSLAKAQQGAAGGDGSQGQPLPPQAVETLINAK